MLSKLQDEDKESQDKNTHEAKIVKNVVDQKKKLAPIKVWFFGRVYKINRNFGNHWVEYRNPI